MLQEDAKLEAIDALYNDIINKQLLLNVEYKGSGFDHVTLVTEDKENGGDIGKSLLAEGYVLIDYRREKRLVKLMNDYQKAQDKAKKERVSIIIFLMFTKIRHLFRSHTYAKQSIGKILSKIHFLS